MYNDFSNWKGSTIYPEKLNWNAYRPGTVDVHVCVCVCEYEYASECVEEIEWVCNRFSWTKTKLLCTRLDNFFLQCAKIHTFTRTYDLDRSFLHHIIIIYVQRDCCCYLHFIFHLTSLSHFFGFCWKIWPNIGVYARWLCVDALWPVGHQLPI